MVDTTSTHINSIEQFKFTPEWMLIIMIRHTETPSHRNETGSSRFPNWGD